MIFGEPMGHILEISTRISKGWVIYTLMRTGVGGIGQSALRSRWDWD